MQIQPASSPFAPSDGSLVVVAATSGDDGPVPHGDLDGLGLDLTGGLAAVEADGSAGSTARLPLPGGGSVLVVGSGDELTRTALRDLGAAASRACATRSDLDVVLPATDDAAAASQAVAEGLVLGAYRFTDHRSDAEAHELATVRVHGPVDAQALAVGQAMGEAQALVRDLVNTAPNHKRPPALAQQAVELAADTGITANVLDGDALRDGGYGGLLAVGQGSSVDPQLVELEWAPEDAAGDHVALVGKGITFDTGGISLKPSSSMETMKMDMGGAATVLAAVLAAARLEVPVRITALLCLAENMPSGTAQRVSDVYTARGGTTVEVMNTDAEGRLVMADGIVHAGELGADVIVDVATLTGAAVVALGDRFSVLMSDDDDLAAGLLAAGEACDEPLWQLPTATEQYRELLDSTVADIKNVGGRKAGTITAGLFLHHFVPDEVRWAHLDIAGSAWTDTDSGIHSKGATGAPARALVTWLRGLG